MTSLDEVCEDQHVSGIDLLKIDVEGYECDVLLGAGRLLRCGAVKNIYIEVCPGNLRRAGSSVQSLWDTWVQFGYQASYINNGLPCRLTDLQQSKLQNVVLRQVIV